jgi:hypothetical protein
MPRLSLSPLLFLRESLDRCGFALTSSADGTFARKKGNMIHEALGRIDKTGNESYCCS